MAKLCGGSRLRSLRRLLLLASLFALVFYSSSSERAPVAAPRRRVVLSSTTAPPVYGGAQFVWVLLGDTHFQAYTMESITQARLLNPTTPFWLVCDEEWLGEGHKWDDALRVANVRKVFYGDIADDFLTAFDAAYVNVWAGRSGMMQPTLNHRTNLDFTRVTMTRLAALQRAMVVHGIARAVHVENDQMVYASADALADAADACGLRLGMTRVGDRFAPAVVYSRDAQSLKDMLDFIYWAISHGADLANQVGAGYPTDMSITASFFDAKAREGVKNATAYGALPPSNDGSCVANKGDMFYDALALGCWCCGDFYVS